MSISGSSLSCGTAADIVILGRRVEPGDLEITGLRQKGRRCTIYSWSTLKSQRPPELGCRGIWRSLTK